jgi:hypothetical protein
MGALEARLETSRMRKAEAAAQKEREQAARDAAVRSRADESAALVREFIDRAAASGIKPSRRLPGKVQQKLSPGYKGILGLDSETVLDSKSVACWHLGKKESGKPSRAYPGGESFDYYLSTDGFHMVAEVGREVRKTWFVGAERHIWTVSWVPVAPDIDDFVMTDHNIGDGVEIRLLEAMGRFFEQHGQG